MQRAQVRVAHGRHLEAKSFQRLVQQRDIVVWIGEAAELAAVSLIADQQRDALARLPPTRP